MACSQYTSDTCVTYIPVSDGGTRIIQAPPTTISAPGDLGHSYVAFTFESAEFDPSWWDE
jgi:hypothetical protein